MNKIIVLTTGYAKSGKDVFSDFLVKNNGFKKYSIASKLKMDTSIKYNIPLASLDTQAGKTKTHTVFFNGKKIEKSGRQFLIDEGTEQRRICEDVYVDSLIYSIKSTGDCKIVVSDTRFPNEIKKIKEKLNEYNILVVKISRFDKSSVDDISERQLDGYNVDYTINNRGCLRDFKEKIYWLINTILL